MNATRVVNTFKWDYASFVYACCGGRMYDKEIEINTYQILKFAVFSEVNDGLYNI